LTENDQILHINIRRERRLSKGPTPAHRSKKETGPVSPTFWGSLLVRFDWSDQIRYGITHVERGSFQWSHPLAHPKAFQFFQSSIIRAHGMRNTNQMLRGDRTR